MAFLSSLKKWLAPTTADSDADLDKEREALRKAWNLDSDDPVLAEPAVHQEIDPTGNSYDEHLWHNKLIHLCNHSADVGTESLGQAVHALLNESRNLGLEPQKVFDTAKEGFEILVRQVVADRQVTLAEHAMLEEVRDALCLPNEVAADLLEKVVKEAENVFHVKIEGV